jgi:hypothetical protein
MTRGVLAVPALVAFLAAGPAVAFEFCSKAAEPPQVAQIQSMKQKGGVAHSNAGGETAGAEAAGSARQGRQQQTREERREQRIRSDSVQLKGMIAEVDRRKAAKGR